VDKLAAIGSHAIDQNGIWFAFHRVPDTNTGSYPQDA
jgi:hypothetical protein